MFDVRFGLRSWVVGLAVASACQSGGDSEDSGSGTSSGGSSTSGFGSGGSGNDGFDADGSGDDAPQGECLLWENECGAGQKCMPYSMNADRVPDTIQCCMAQDTPDLIGEPCEIFDYDGSCLDSCEQGSMCVLDEEDSLRGLCRAFCQPAQNDCEPNQTCKSFFELLPATPTVPLCMDQCDPIVQNCPQPTWHCIPDTPTESGQSGFLCSPPPPEEPKGALETCALANDCEKGLVCVTADRIPGCTFLSCCTTYCSLSEGDAACQGLNPDFECVDWMSPDPTWSDVGVCALPDN